MLLIELKMPKQPESTVETNSEPESATQTVIPVVTKKIGCFGKTSSITSKW